MTPEQQEKALNRLKSNIRESSSPFFGDQEIFDILDDCGYDIRKASYEALIRKAEDDSITLPSGLTVPNNRKYWLSLAKRYRGNAGGNIGRGDYLADKR